MKITGLVTLLVAVLFCISSANRAIADTFGSGANMFDVEFVNIGNPGNTADTTGDPNPVGSVGYTYRIGKFEISEDMIDKANALGGLSITKDNRGPDKPATNLSWFEAATFVNWLNTSTGGTPAYKFNGSNLELWAPSDAGYNASNLFRNSLAKYFLPSADEWYKAAFYNPTGGIYFDFPTGNNTAPTALASGIAAGTAVYEQSFGTGPADVTQAGGLSPFGTMGQGGNVGEWEETEFDLVNDLVSSIPPFDSSMWGIRGGDWVAGENVLAATERGGGITGGDNVGFRVASIPEPSSLLLLGMGLARALGLRRWTGV